MELVKIIDGNPVPYTEAAFRADNKHTAYGPFVSPRHLNPQGVYRVRYLPKPTPAAGYKVVEAQGSLQGSEWVIGWSEVAMTQDEINKLSVPKEVFLANVFESGILTEADALDAAEGKWPASLNGFFSGMTGKEKIMAKGEWQKVTTIRRNAPMVVGLQAFLGLTDEQVNALFI